MPDTFISYAHRDKAQRKLAVRIAEALRKRGVSGWSDSDIPLGEPVSDSLQRELREARIFVLLLSPRTVESPGSLFELGVALNRAAAGEVRIVPVLIDGAKWEDLELPIRELATIDGNDMSLDELVEEVATVVAGIALDFDQRVGA